LDAQLAYRRHFPAINWLNSNSLYLDKITPYIEKSGYAGWTEMEREAMRILEEESELQEIVRLVGIDALSEKDRLTLEAARSLREDYLHQNAFHEIDTFTSIDKQHKMLKLILDFNDFGQKALEQGAYLSKILSLPVRDRISRAKYISEAEMAKIDDISAALRDEMNSLVEGGLINA
jgi:V/A-type H+-transporting ATPase subunit A